MSKKLKKFLTFFTVFFWTTLAPLGGYYYYQYVKTPYVITLFADENIRKTCPLSPEKEIYSLCLQKKLSRMYAQATLFDLHKINSLITEIKERDEYLISIHNASRDDIYFNFFKNWIIAIDHMANFQLDRKHLSFMAVFIFPILKQVSKKQIIELQDQIKELQFETERTKKLQQKLLSVSW